MRRIVAVLGGNALVTNPERLAAALLGEAGTIITRRS
jgi:hypothetical protein